MNDQTVMTIMMQAMKIAMTTAGPLLLIALTVGLMVSIFQAATQINEMTLTFIPKVLALSAALVLIGPWMLGQMVDYIRLILSQIPTIVS
jgi:flagellar biosynthetic protein FliQ